jgi:ABC-type nitrate/sulfonate/bicarbonate transport system permease component
VRGTDEVMRDTASSYRITRLQRLAYLVLPAAGPKILTGVRQSLSIALILMVISEMFGSSSGLGFLITFFQRNFAIPEMWSGILLLGLIGFGLSVVFRLIERRILRWYHGLREVQREG